MEQHRTVLIVSEDPARLGRWSEWLARAGYTTLRCPGPTMTSCPRLNGMPCGLRQIADAAVVEVQGPGEPYPYGEWRARGCTTLPDDGTTIFVSERESTALDELEHPITPMALLDSVEHVLGGRHRIP